MVIGSETEYGLFCNAGAPEYIGLKLVKSIEGLNLRFFSRPLEGITDLKEHEEMDNAITDEKTLQEQEERASRHAIAQRRGVSGYVLINGSRFYLDMSHPEYCPPETLDPMSAMVHQRAGDILVEQCRRALERELKDAHDNLIIQVHKNNSDGKGASYGGHENYSLSPQLFDSITTEDMGHRRVWSESEQMWDSAPVTNLDGNGIFVLNFFITRQLLTGSGKVGNETGKKVDYQITQRADFFVVEANNHTTSNRGIINTRNMPYADRNICRRFHVICADSNMSQLSLFLKFATAKLFFMMLQDGFLQREGAKVLWTPKNGVLSFKNVSRDLTLKHELHFKEGRVTALEMQKEYCALAKKFVERNDLPRVWHRAVAYWEKVLNGLDTNRHKNEWSQNLDWVLKERILKQYQKKNKVDPLSDTCREIDLQYHNINPKKSVFYRYEDNDAVLKLATESEIKNACHQAPTDTRAWLRGEVLKRFGSHLKFIGWNRIQTSNTDIDMPDPNMATKDQLAFLFEGDPALNVFLDRLKALEKETLEQVGLALDTLGGW